MYSAFWGNPDGGEGSHDEHASSPVKYERERNLASVVKNAARTYNESCHTSPTGTSEGTQTLTKKTRDTYKNEGAKSPTIRGHAVRSPGFGQTLGRPESPAPLSVNRVVRPRVRVYLDLAFPERSGRPRGVKPGRIREAGGLRGPTSTN
jgi:hypothetical protein